MILALFALTFFCLALYSYALVDPNFTLLNSALWTSFRNFFVAFGYYQRPLSWLVFLILIFLLFLLQLWAMKKYRGNILLVAIVLGVISLCAYPFLSHDLFNYFFDAKILTFYHQNPYLHKALDFPIDPWLRFMHWTHRTYPYGPVFLGVTLIPSYLSFGKLLITFLLFKSLWVGFYLAAVYALLKVHKKSALFFATSPLILVEGLMSAHNDMIATCLGIIAVVVALQKMKVWGWIFMVLSIGIKYSSAPFIFLLFHKKWSVPLALIVFSVGVAYLATKTGIYSWYFLNLFIIVPYVKEKAFIPLTILSIFLLLSYYPYIALGFWDKQDYVTIKNVIILTGIIATGVVLIFQTYFVRRESKSS